MNQKQIAGVTVSVDEEGYLTDHAQWNRDVAIALAQEEGIELTPAHWKVLEFIDKDFREKGCCSRYAPHEQNRRHSDQGSL
jgi:TusE/DsrC/DsvC family sulfur relay protein